MATEAPLPSPPPEQRPRTQKAQALQSDVSGTTDQVSSFISLKNQLARVEGSLSTKEASLALARDLLRAREEEIVRTHAALAKREGELSESTARSRQLEADLAQTRDALENQRVELLTLRSNLAETEEKLTTWRGLALAFARKLLMSARYGAAYKHPAHPIS
jgi:hypothetical protein